MQRLTIATLFKFCKVNSNRSAQEKALKNSMASSIPTNLIVPLEVEQSRKACKTISKGVSTGFANDAKPKGMQ